MGANTIGASGVGLPPPAALYPVTIGTFPGVTGTNRISLPPGGDILIPAGTWLITPGQYSSIQILDPVTGTWVPVTSAGTAPEISINSDGVNYRIVNPLGFPVASIVTGGGSAYTSAPTVTATPGGSTWTAVVGGAVSAINCAAASSGAGYAVPPIVSIAAPPSPGVQATATCTVSGGSISAFTIVNAGAGYSVGSPPAVVIQPQQSDLNQVSTSTTVTTNAVATAQLSNVGQVTAVLLTNEGSNPLAAAPALTFSGGAGSGATATAIMALTMVNYSVTAAGSGYAMPVEIRTFGGTLATQSSGISAIANPAIGAGMFVPRVAVAIGSTAANGVTVLQAANSGVVDGGLFQMVPLAYAVPGPAGTGTTVATIAPIMGSVSDTVFIQPL